MPATVSNKAYIPLPTAPTDELDILPAKLKLELSVISTVDKMAELMFNIFAVFTLDFAKSNSDSSNF